MAEYQKDVKGTGCCGGWNNYPWGPGKPPWGPKRPPWGPGCGPGRHCGPGRYDDFGPWGPGRRRGPKDKW